jgi:hypothetical protein
MKSYSLDYKENKNKKVFLLFDQRHFTQILPIVKSYPAQDVEIIPLDTYSLMRAKESGYRFTCPKYRDKIMIRQRLLRRMPFFIKAWGEASINGLKLKRCLKVKETDLWEVLKCEIGILLFDKLYFLELVKFLLIRSRAKYLILPQYPSLVQLTYLTKISRRTILNLAESIGMKVINKVRL